MDIRKADRNGIQGAKIKFLRSIKKCSRLKQNRNEVIRKELNIGNIFQFQLDRAEQDNIPTHESVEIMRK